MILRHDAVVVLHGFVSEWRAADPEPRYLTFVNPQPTSTTIDQRTAAIQELVKAFHESEDWELLLSSLAGVIGGFESGFAQDSVAVQR